jgi:4-carboxymuconolactone decarboxylase
MARLAPLDPTKLTEEQKKVWDAIAGRRGEVPGPMQLLLRSPELADKAQALGQFVRWSKALGPRLNELAICVVARHWGSQIEWAGHSKAALEAGVSEENMRAIAERRPPNFTKPDEQVVYEFTRAVLETHKVPEDLYQRILAALGEQGLVELVGAIGFYDLIAVLLATFDVQLPAGRKAELPE